MSNKLSLMPNISIPRSRFKQKFNHSLDMFHGDVVPVDCFEVVPGDEFSYNLSSLIRMSTPIIPIMGNIKACIHAAFVPLRLIWTDAEKFYGDPSNHDKVSSITPVDPTTVTVPYIASGSIGNDPFLYSVQDYLGKQDLKAIQNKFFLNDSAGWSAWLDKLHLSALKERAYLKMWNDLFRPSLLVPPVIISGGNYTTVYGTASFISGGNLIYPFKPLKGFKQYDYFTAGTLSPQFGASVELPLGSYAPVGVIGSSNLTIAAGTINSIGTPGQAIVEGFNPYKYYYNGASNSDSVVADLSAATAATINQIRYAFQLQKYFERSNYGSRYFEILNAHYGITNPDSRLQRAERLGSHEFYINVSQVVSTADTVNGASGQNLGNTGAVSCTGDNCHLFTKSFTEPGYVIVVITTKYDRSYSSGFLREDLKANRFEFYSPEFANLGDQGTKKVEIQVEDILNQINDPEEVQSYNEHWAEYRYRKDLVSGSLRPGQSMDIWTLADDFEAQDIVPGYGFLHEDRSSLARVLASGSVGPDYICDFRANILATREMPTYSIPGLIDHFGAL